ncbi:MAG: YjgP/YjgQ family permease [Alphaproteobacteria bacterium]|nr:YjgP/YjgQ family permease [Alphaproteobacteria bacterium]
MTITARYIASTIAKPLLSAIAIGLLVLLADRLVRLLDITLGKKNSLGIVFEMLTYLVPHYLGLALPAALFLGLLFGFNSLSKNSELDAFMATGIGLHQLVRPVLILAGFFSLLALLIVGWVQPQARYAFRAIVHSVQNVEIFFLAEAGVFMQAGSRTFILDKLSRKNNRFERIFLFEDKKAEGSLTLTSTGGALVEHEGDPRPILRLREGHRLRIDGIVEEEAAAKPLPPHVVGEFNNVDTPIGRIVGTKFRLRGIDHRELSIWELFSLREKPPAKTSKPQMMGELHKRVVTILSIMLLPILAVPFAIGRRRGHRSYRFALAVVILVVYHEVLEQGALLAKLGKASPWFSVWIPFLALAAFSFWQFYSACFTLKPAKLEPTLDWLIDRIERVKTSLQQRLKAA